MTIETIPLNQVGTDLHKTLSDCADSGLTMVIELPDHRLVAIQPLDPSDEDDDLINNLIANNPKFRELIARSEASGRKPFPFLDK
jgi:hypothetical protein